MEFVENIAELFVEFFVEKLRENAEVITARSYPHKQEIALFFYS